MVCIYQLWLHLAADDTYRVPWECIGKNNWSHFHSWVYMKNNKLDSFVQILLTGFFSIYLDPHRNLWVLLVDARSICAFALLLKEAYPSEQWVLHSYLIQFEQLPHHHSLLFSLCFVVYIFYIHLYWFLCSIFRMLVRRIWWGSPFLEEVHRIGFENNIKKDGLFQFQALRTLMFPNQTFYINLFELVFSFLFLISF